MSKTTSVRAVDVDKKLQKIDIRSAIIASILAFGIGAYAASDKPANGAANPPAKSAPAAAAASSGK